MPSPIGIGFILTGDDSATTVKSRVDTADRNRIPDTTIEAPASVVEAAKRTEVGAHQGQKDETPTVAPNSQLIAARKQQNRISKTQDPLPVAGASQGFPGCITRFVQNQSSRRRVRPQQIWDHYTVSPNRPGWSDVNAIVALFDRRSFSASSHFVIDSEGHCAYIVPIEAKSWTQAAANAIAVSIEIINSGREGRLMDPAGTAKLVAVHREIGRRTGIPMQRGVVRGCTSARRGIVQHKDGGICAGGHVDITPYSIDQVVSLSRSPPQ